MAVLSLVIEGMHCGACVRRVMQAVNAVPGAHADEVRVGQARVTTTGDTETLLAALAQAGYPAQVATTAP